MAHDTRVLSANLTWPRSNYYQLVSPTLKERRMIFFYHNLTTGTKLATKRVVITSFEN
jgi:hypothetical protein